MKFPPVSSCGYQYQLKIFMLENGINNRNWFFAAPARLPGFHVCVGSGGERQLPEWYKDNGKGLSFFFSPIQYNSTTVEAWFEGPVHAGLHCSK